MFAGWHWYKVQGTGDVYGEVESGTGIYKSHYKSCSHKFAKGSSKIQIKQKIERTN